jgi:hypothetical protein
MQGCRTEEGRSVCMRWAATGCLDESLTQLSVSGWGKVEVDSRLLRQGRMGAGSAQTNPCRQGISRNLYYLVVFAHKVNISAGLPI